MSSGRRGRPVTGRAFGDLALWMVGFGLLTGAVFPLIVVGMGVPERVVMKGSFYACTLTAGLAVGGTNFLLARWVVGRRLRELSQRMAYVAGVIRDATGSGDWSRCSPRDCELTVDSADELGEAAASFNGLLYALARSRDVEQTMARFGESLVHRLDVSEVSEVALHGFVTNGGASGGVLGVIRNSQLVVTAAHRCEPESLVGSLSLPTLLAEKAPTVVVDALQGVACPDGPTPGSSPKWLRWR